MARKHVIAAAAAAAVMLVPSGAHAANGSSSSTKAATLNTIAVNVTAQDHTSCSHYTVLGVSHWQCTPVLIGTATPVQPLIVTGGSISWYMYGTCEWRKRADGLNNNWTSWASCSPSFSKSTSGSRSWALLGTPSGNLTQFNWNTVDNAESLGFTDCVEIRTSMYVSSTASDPIESVSTSTRFPSSGTRVDGICEGGGAY